MIGYERCPYCKEILEVKAEIKKADDFGESMVKLTEHNIENAIIKESEDYIKATIDNLNNSGFFSKSELNNIIKREFHIENKKESSENIEKKN